MSALRSHLRTRVAWTPRSHAGSLGPALPADGWTILRPRRPRPQVPEAWGMTERAAYSRVYWSIVDDPKFESVYDSDSNLAAWLRLLLIADQAHPASAHLPSNVRRSSVAE